MRGADVGIVAVARHVEQDRDEIVEAVDARQHPHARPVGERRDDGGELEQLLLADLEQLVARIGVERRHQRLAGMALRIEAASASSPRRSCAGSAALRCAALASDIEVKRPRMRSSPETSPSSP